MQPDKKQLEILLIHYFRTCYADFPKSVVSPSESPDFILTLKNKHQLGIELTRLHPGDSPNYDEFRSEQNKFRDHLVAFAREIFEQDSSICLFVKFLFSDVKPVGKEKELIVAVQAANTIRKALISLETNHFFRISIPAAQLPDGLEEILIVHDPVLKTSVWERANNLGMSVDVIDDVRQSIYKKDEKLRIYQKQHLNYYWLLVTADRLRGLRNFNLPDKIINHSFESRFQRVLLFDLMKQNVIKLV